MNLLKRIKYLPGAIKRGMVMGASKKGLIKGCVRFLFTGKFRKPMKDFVLGTKC